MKTAHQALTEARALIATPETWTQQAFARATNGEAIYYRSPDAVCFCALGALNRVLDHEDETLPHPSFRALSRAASALFTLDDAVSGSPAAVNDQLGHEAVLAMYDHALEASKP